MSNKSFRVVKSLNIKPKPTTSVDASQEGDIDWDSTYHRPVVHNGSSVVNVLTSVDASAPSFSTAANIANVPSGNLVATNVQGALNEVQSDLDAHKAASSAHGVSGDLVGTSDPQNITNKTISALFNTISAIANVNIAAAAAIALDKLASLTASRAVVTNGSGVLTASSVTATELGYLSGTTGTTGTGNLVRATGPTVDTLTLTSREIFPAITTPASPSASNYAVYAKSDGNLYILNSAGSERVVGPYPAASSCIIRNSSGQVIANGNTVQYTNKVYDPNNLFSTSTYEFTAPSTGTYVIEVFNQSTSFTPSAGNRYQFDAYVNGVQTCRVASFTANAGIAQFVPIQGTGVVRANAGQAIKLVADISSGTITMQSSDVTSWISIRKVSD